MMDRLTARSIRLRAKVQTLLSDQKGATATEYGILMAFLVVIALAGVSLFGLAVGGWYNELASHLKAVLGIP